MDGGALAARIREELKGRSRELGDVGLATVLVGEDPASAIYIRRKHKAAGEAGDRRYRPSVCRPTRPRRSCSGSSRELNDDDLVDGILVQTPLPEQLDEARVMRAIDPVKDVDGLHPFSAGQLYLGRPTLVPATPLGVMRLLDEYGSRSRAAGGRRRAERDRREAGRAPAPAGECDGDDLPLAH